LITHLSASLQEHQISKDQKIKQQTRECQLHCKSIRYQKIKRSKDQKIKQQTRECQLHCKSIIYQIAKDQKIKQQTRECQLHCKSIIYQIAKDQKIKQQIREWSTETAVVAKKRAPYRLLPKVYDMQFRVSLHRAQHRAALSSSPLNVSNTTDPSPNALRRAGMQASSAVWSLSLARSGLIRLRSQLGEAQHGCVAWHSTAWWQR
jgi:hypothetical protein